MNTRNTIVAALVVACAPLAFAPAASAAEWITAPSYYTHDPASAERVNQYSQIGPFYYYQRPDYMQSGYRHNRSTFQFGGSADNLHIVEEWGRPVRPYDEWRFPFRPYSAPYPYWGQPFGGLGGGWGGGWFPGVGPIPFGGGGGAGAGIDGGPGFGPGFGFPSGPFNTAQPWTDGYWPRYNRNDRSPYYRPYRPEPPFAP
jgi:hypothetical protein